MIQCKECGFSVNEMMRFALMKNICPSCGSGLLSSRDSSIIGSIQNRISSQRFSSGFSESQIYDLSLFIFNELKDGFGKIAMDLVKSGSGKSIPREVSHTEDDEVDNEFEEDDISDIRRSVAAEFIPQEDDEDDESEGNEDIDQKAERLRRLHQQRVMNDQAPVKVQKPFKRGGFRGVTRSET